MKMEKLNGELRKFISLGRKILTLQIDPLPCEHPLKSSVPFRSGPFRSVPFSCERGLRNTEADLRVPLFKTSNGQKSISFRGPKFWNQLSSAVKHAHPPPLSLTSKGSRKRNCRWLMVSFLWTFIELVLFLLK